MGLLREQTLDVFERGAMPRVSQRGASVEVDRRDEVEGLSRNFGGEILNVSRVCQQNFPSSQSFACPSLF